MTTTPRLKLHYPTGTDPADVPSDNGALANGIDRAAVYDQGALASRPAAALPGLFWTDPATGLVYLDTGTTWLVLNAAPVEAPGTLKLTARPTADPGWLLADGSAVSRTTYADLYAVIGTTYGTGNGTSTFNLPDFRDRAIMGAGPTNALGTRPGSPSHTHVVLSHAHTVPDHAHYMPDHSHYAADHAHPVNILSGVPDGASPNFVNSGSSNAAGRNSHVGVNGSTGGVGSLQTSGRAEGGQNTYGAGAIGTSAQPDTTSGPSSTLQPSQTCNVLVKT